jgi:hypothetical protein
VPDHYPENTSPARPFSDRAGESNSSLNSD